jgi:hypothetical protein
MSTIINSTTNLIDNSVTANYKNSFTEHDNIARKKYNVLPFQLGVIVAATITTSATLPNQPILVGSSVSSDLGLQVLGKGRKYPSQSDLAAFTTELKKRSKSLSADDAQLLRKMKLSKSQTGIPRF